MIVVINGSEKTPIEIQEQNLKTFKEAQKWAVQQSQNPNLQWLQFLIRYFPDLPPKHAGVDLARKIGMDEAVERLENAGNKRGIIACFDADSQCQTNYFQALETHFLQYPKTQACSIHFEHPIEGTEFPPSVYEAIIQYELHLRYYIEAQKWAGFPHAYQTIGSSMAVRADAYKQQGGMNRRKAGEDFYFLHKFTPLGHFSELNSTCVIPSPRLSDRVPFGTGKAIADLLQQTESASNLKTKANSSPVYHTYDLQSFVDLQHFFLQLPQFYRDSSESFSKRMKILSSPIFHFLLQINFEQKLQKIRNNTRNYESFRVRFFRWFNAFMVMKFVHFARDAYYPNIEVAKAARDLLESRMEFIPSKPHTYSYTAKELLLIYRRLACK